MGRLWGALRHSHGGDPFRNFGRLSLRGCAAASRAFGSVYRHVLKDLDLTYPQYLVMLVLGENGPLPVKELGTLLRLDSGTLSPLIKRLETAGYVRRERGTQDERSVTVHPTETGAALRDKALSVSAPDPRRHRPDLQRNRRTPEPARPGDPQS